MGFITHEVLDKDGNEKLYGYYAKYTGEDGEYKSGLAVYDDAMQELVLMSRFQQDAVRTSRTERPFAGRIGTVTGFTSANRCPCALRADLKA